MIEEVTDLLGDLDKAPKFLSEASHKIESFFNDLMRLYQFVIALVEQPASLADAAFAAVLATLEDLRQQAAAFDAPQAAMVQTRVDEVTTTLGRIGTELKKLAGKSFDVANPLDGIDLADALDAPVGIGRLRKALSDLRAVAAAPTLPAGFRQAVNTVVGKATALLGAVASLAGLYGHGKSLFDALKDLLHNSAPGQSIGELITTPDLLAPKIKLIARPTESGGR